MNKDVRLSGRLGKMNLAIRGIEGNLGAEPADTFHRDLHKEFKADYVLANFPFNVSDWGGDRLREDVRWKFAVPPVGHANFAWIQPIIHDGEPFEQKMKRLTAKLEEQFA